MQQAPTDDSVMPMEEGLLKKFGIVRGMWLNILIDHYTSEMVDGNLDENEFCILPFEKVSEIKEDTFAKQDARMKLLNNMKLIQLADSTENHWKYRLLMPSEQNDLFFEEDGLEV